MEAPDEYGQLKELLILLKDMVRRKFYGRLEIAFEQGKIVLLRKVQNIKINA